MDNDVQKFMEELVTLCWYTRGSMQIHDAYDSTYDERKAISKLAERNLETTKKSGISFV